MLVKTIDQRRLLPANDNGQAKAPLADVFPDLAAWRGAPELDQVPRADILRQLELQMGLAG